jgi:hypothetical protein
LGTPFSYDPAVLTGIEKAFSDDFSPYLKASLGDIRDAVALYERNSMVSSAFYVPLQIVELTLRNACRRQLEALWGSAWGAEQAFRALDEGLCRKIDETKNAVFDFGFWTRLLSPHLAPHLWDRGIHKAFPNFQNVTGSKLSRKPVATRFNNIRNFRNAVFHHEPIVFRSNLNADYASLREAVAWMSQDVVQWMDGVSVCQYLPSLLGSRAN